jgi:phenylpropionate dioxygenase-like ring-hydroxylating dioxygenase large terminal subunit
MLTQAADSPPSASIMAYYTGLRSFWHAVLRAEDLPEGQPKGLSLLGEQVVVVRLNGSVVAMQDVCRHFQARLSLGEVVEHGGEQCLMCAYHGWSYDQYGQCVNIPQLAAGREIPRDAQVPSYLVREQYGLLWVCLQAEPQFDIPDFPELDDPGFHAGPLRVYDPWQASAPRIIMGALDDTHFPWVHPGLLGDRAHTDPPIHRVERQGRYLVSRYDILQPKNVGASYIPGKGTGDELTRVSYTNYVGMPGVIRLVKVGEGSTCYVIWMATCPHSYNCTTSFWRVMRNYDRDPDRDSHYEDFEDRVRAQDKVIVESQRPWLLPPFWTKIELPLRPADLPLIEYQKWLEELGIAVDV